MELSTIVGIIGVFATIFSPIVAILVASWLKNKDFKRINNNRKNTLEGTWVGSGMQEVGLDGEKNFPMKISGSFLVSRKEVVGNIEIIYDIDDKKVVTKMIFKGGFFYDRYLQFQYKNNNSDIIQFGSVLLELNSSGTRLDGRFLGYGAYTENLVYGQIQLCKYQQNLGSM